MEMIEEVRKSLLSQLTGEGAETLQNTPVSFSMGVETLANDENLSLLEALTLIVEQHSLDFEHVPKLITLNLKQKLALESGIEKPRAGLDME